MLPFPKGQRPEQAGHADDARVVEAVSPGHDMRIG
jgi:hypothetical protein